MTNRSGNGLQQEGAGVPASSLKYRLFSGFRDFLIDPRVYLAAAAVVVAWLGTVVYQHYEPFIARHLARIAVDQNNFTGADGTSVPNPIVVKMDSLMQNRIETTEIQERIVNSFLKTLQDRDVSPELKYKIGKMVVAALLEFDDSQPDDGDLRKKLSGQIRTLISKELDKIGLMETMYGRVDSVFSKTVDLSYDTGHVSTDIRFVAEKNQQIRLRFSHDLLIEQPDGTIVHRKLGDFRVKGTDEKMVQEGLIYDITDIVPFRAADDVQTLEISLSPGAPLVSGETARVEVTIIVQNSLRTQRKLILGQTTGSVGAENAGVLGSD